MNKRVYFGFLIAMIMAMGLIVVPDVAATSAGYSIEVEPSKDSETGDGSTTYRYKTTIGDEENEGEVESSNPAAFLMLVPFILIWMIQPMVFFAVIIMLISKVSKAARQKNGAMVVKRSFMNATNNPMDGYIVPNAAPKTTGFHYEKQKDVSPIQSMPAPVGTAPTILGDAAKPQTKIELDEYGRPKPII